MAVPSSFMVGGGGQPPQQQPKPQQQLFRPDYPNPQGQPYQQPKQRIYPQQPQSGQAGQAQPQRFSQPQQSGSLSPVSASGRITQGGPSLYGGGQMASGAGWMPQPGAYGPGGLYSAPTSWPGQPMWQGSNQLTLQQWLQANGQAPQQGGAVGGKTPLPGQPLPPQVGTGQQPQSPVQALLASGVQFNPANESHWVTLPNGDRVPFDHAAAAGAAPQGPPASGPGSAAAPLSPYGQYPVNPGNTVYQPGDLGSLPFSTYSQTYQARPSEIGDAPGYFAGQLSQYGGSGIQGNTALQSALLGQVLQNPESLSPQIVAQLKEQQKEGALSMQRQLGDLLDVDAARRGMSGSGYTDALQRQLGQDTISQVAGSNRAIDIAAAQQNMADRLNALGMGDQVMSGQAGRAQGDYQTQLAGQLGQEGLHQFQSQNALDRAGFALSRYDTEEQSRRAAADDAFRASQSTFGAEQAAYERQLAQEAMRQAGAASGLQNYQADLGAYFDWLAAQRGERGLDITQQLGEGALGVDRSRLGEQGRQFDLTHALNLQQFLENQRQFNNTLGFNYTGLELGGQQSLINAILGF